MAYLPNLFSGHGIPRRTILVNYTLAFSHIIDYGIVATSIGSAIVYLALSCIWVIEITMAFDIS